MSVCLTAAGITIALALERFALAWTHSAEHTEWRELWRSTSDGLILEEVMVKGSGAGIDPPAGARLDNGFWRWRPDAPPRVALTLADAGLGRPWFICADRVCVEANAIVPAAGRTLVIEPCAAPGVPLAVFAR